MPEAVETLVQKLLADPAFYPEKSEEERKAAAYGIAHKQVEGSAFPPIEFVASEDGGEFSMVMASDGAPAMLLFKNQVLARAEVNSNRDEIDEKGIDDLVGSISGWPIDIEHDRSRIAGVFTAARKDGLAARVDGAIWADLYPQEARAVMSGEFGLSILARARTAQCSMCGGMFSSAENYCEHLRNRRNNSAIRKLSDLKARGGAITRRPAASNAKFDPSQIYIVAAHQEQSIAAAHWYDDKLPAGETLDDLPDSDFADPEGRRFPYKIHGKVYEDGWRAAWSAAHGGHTGRRDESAIARLRRDKPKGVDIKESTMTEEEIKKLQDDYTAALARIGELEPIAAKAPELERAATELETENADLKARLEAERNARLEAEHKANEMIASARRARFGKLLSDEEWENQKEALLALPETTFELIAAKLAATPARNGDKGLVVTDSSGETRVTL